jgi:orotate phosphoribosyltransferase
MKPMSPGDATQLLQDCGTLLTGHFVYASGKHADVYVNKDRIFMSPSAILSIAQGLAGVALDMEPEVLVGPAIGGAILANATACAMWPEGEGVSAVYAEKTENKGYELRRGYDQVVAGKRVVVIDDVLTTGGSVKAVIEAVRACGGDVLGAVVVCLRGEVTSEMLGVPSLEALCELRLPAYDEDACPLCAAGMPVSTDVGKGREWLRRR